MAAYTANAAQNVNPGESVIFTATTIPCNLGLVFHSDDTGNFLLAGKSFGNQNGCICRRSNTVNYNASFSANIAIPEGGTAGEISVAFVVDGSTIPASAMIVTPAAVGDFFNVSCDIPVPIFKGCCQSLSIRNTSSQPITVQNASLVITR